MKYKAQIERQLFNCKLRDDQWKLLEPIIIARNSPGIQGKDNRLFIEAVFWIVSNRLPWIELPAEFGNWRTVYMRYKRWALSGMWQRLVQGAISDCTLQLVLKEVEDFGDEYLRRRKVRKENALRTARKIMDQG